MNLTSSSRIKFDELRTLAFGGISANYAMVGAIFANPVRTLKIWNGTDANLIISYDGGTTDQDFCPATGGFVYDYGSNMATQAGFLEQPVRQSVSVKLEAAAATTGNVYVTVIYAGQN